MRCAFASRGTAVAESLEMKEVSAEIGYDYTGVSSPH